MPVDDLLIREAPPRLAEGDDAAAEGLRALALSARPDARAEVIAWGRVSERAAGAARRWLWSGAFVAAGVLGVVWFTGLGAVPAPMAVAPTASSPPAPVTAPLVVPNIVASRVETSRPARPTRRALAVASGEAPRDASADASAAPARVKLSRRAVRLAAGRAALAAEATVEVAGGTAARASADRAWVRVTLDRGEVGLHVTKRVPGGPGFEVVAGAYHFRVLGTRFRVARVPTGIAPVELWVEEGRVAVSRHGHVLSVVEAGGHWGATPAASPALAATARRAAVRRKLAARETLGPVTEVEPASGTPMVTRARCAVLADEAATAREAVTCYLEQSHRDGVTAETALYEVARLRRDMLGDTEGALAALRETRQRFPRGMLRHEVDLSIVELLPKLNRHGEAIEEIGRMLSEGHGEERAAELHVLRGNIYREVLEDFVRAERDYAVAETARAPVVGEATFLRGVCLQALGHANLARAAFDRYLASGSHRFADEAKRRLARLN